MLLVYWCILATTGNIITPRSHLVKDFLEENKGVHFVDHEVFFHCFVKIRPWLDLSTLANYLTKYGVVTRGDDMLALTSPHLTPQDKMTSLIQLVEKAGSDGFMFLYMCLRDSSEECRGHNDAVRELDHYGKRK